MSGDPCFSLIIKSKKIINELDYREKFIETIKELLQDKEELGSDILSDDELERVDIYLGLLWKSIDKSCLYAC